ncbi:MAG: hypothetical protein ACOCXA_00015 [Planctomycetota bacterium]
MPTAKHAHTAFRNHIRDCHALLAVIEDLLEEEAFLPDAEVDWGHAGSMSDLRESLITLLIPSHCAPGCCEEEARKRIEAAMRTKKV